MPRVVLDFDSFETFNMFTVEELGLIAFNLRQKVAKQLSTDDDKITAKGVEVLANIAPFSQNADQICARIIFSTDKRIFNPSEEQILATTKAAKTYLRRCKAISSKKIAKVSAWAFPNPGGIYL